MSFGVTDYLGLADTQLKPQSSTLNPSGATADAPDSMGDIVAQTDYNKAKQWSVTYGVKCGDSFAVSTKVKGGQIIAIDSGNDAVVTQIELATSNGEFPTITVQADQFFGDSDGQGLYTPPFAVAALKQAQLVGATVVAGTRVQSCTARLTLELVRLADSMGAYVCANAYGAKAESTLEGLNPTGAAGFTADTTNGWAIPAGVVGASTSNSAYATGGVTLRKFVARD